MNRLEHMDEFRQLLADYHISPAGLRLLPKVQLALLVGVSASGRDTIIGKLLESGRYEFLISDTTRLPRRNDGVLEQNGREYWFRDETDFLADLKAGKYLEAEVMFNQQMSGISIRELRKAAQHGKIAIRNVDLNIRSIMQVKPDTVALVVVPPNFDEWMRRLAGRGHMEPAEKRRRLITACEIFEAGLTWEFFTIVVNEKVSEAAQTIDRRVTSGQADPVQQAEGRKVLEALLRDTRALLARGS